ncbi:3-oxoacid CoA-transferase [Treponema phagedenis]|uniref:acyl CoA:acetate/3-ketoacid CoA transferase n=1 Tax=Treponema phagedenis TaxID=162 RepID=UPI0011E674F6|nr:CoA-transferase [Treponema phagedenis]QEJ95308.1 3-oxoacid CoA-transferase [Treponema phagedenis]
MVEFCSAKDVANIVTDNSVIATNGFVGIGVAEEILTALENRYLETKSPKNLELYFAAGQGDSKDRGLNHLGYEGLVKRTVGGHWNLVPKLQELALSNKMQSYNFPQGVISHMFRDRAIGLNFTISKVGLKTYCDPRLEGGKLNSISTEDLVELIEIDGEEFLKYKTPKLDFVILRGTYADEVGNISLENEALTIDAYSLAAAGKACNAKVIVQVEDVVEKGTLDPRLVKIPCVMVDYVVKTSDVAKYHCQTFGTLYNPSLCGNTRAVLSKTPPVGLTNRKVCARRAAEFFEDGYTANLGIGMPETVAMVINEEGQGDKINMSVEPGITGGVPLGGLDFGASINPLAIVDQVYQFDFYNGGGLDIAVLGLAQVDKYGNVNVSKFGTRVAGCGGFIDISQNVKKCIFIGTFTAGGLKQKIGDGKLEIIEEGKSKKFIDEVEQVTFSAQYAREIKQEVYYITERAVFTLGDESIKLIEIAPGVDLQRDVLDLMDFRPEIAENLKTMDANLFKEDKIGLIL